MEQGKQNVSYCFHEGPDVTAFPWFWAVYVTFGLQDIQVQVIHVACWPLYVHSANTSYGECVDFQRH